MEWDKLEKLLARYDEGETSLAEEQELREYFSTNEIPEELYAYKLMFAYASREKKETFEAENSVKTSKAKYAWTSIAAMIAIMLGIYFFNDHSGTMQEQQVASLSEEEMALEQTKETLKMVSEFMNEGTADLVYLKEFNNTKNKIIQLD